SKPRTIPRLPRDISRGACKAAIPWARRLRAPCPTSTGSTPSWLAPNTVAASCAIPSPVSRPGWRKPTIPAPSAPNAPPSPTFRESRRRGFGNLNRPRFTSGSVLMTVVDLSSTSVRELNQALHDLDPQTGEKRWRVLNPRGLHAIAVGLNVPIEIEIDGHVGYYCAGMNKLATVRINGNAATGVGENMMSGEI